MQLRKLSTFKSLIAHVRPSRAVASVWYKCFSLSLPESACAHTPQVLHRITPRDATLKDLSFTFAVIALSAQVAMAGGKLSGEKYLAFRDAFPLTGGMCGKIRKLFILACQNQAPPEHYTNQIKYTFPRQQLLFYSLVDRLFGIACAGGDISREAEHLLARIAHQLELKATEYSAIRDHHLAPKAHEVLGVQKNIKASELKKQYHQLMRKYHPDRFASETLSPEVEMLLSLKTSEINHAYRTLSKKAA
jgi:DnaJ like chaperone protein